ncbi:MAG: hypothetical protein V4610_14210 [Pseudomonadota bacterium]
MRKRGVAGIGVRVLFCLGLATATLAIAAPPGDQGTAPGAANFKSLLDLWKANDTPADQRPVASVPFDRSLESFRYTLPFGVRADPFRGDKSFHAGVDLAAALGTPVHATGDAIVARAGLAMVMAICSFLSMAAESRHATVICRIFS